MKKINIPQINAVSAALWGLAVFAWAVILALSDTYAAFSGMPYALAKALIGCATLKLIDELMLSEIKTMQLLKEDAKGYALYMLGYAVIIGWAFANA